MNSLSRIVILISVLLLGGTGITLIFFNQEILQTLHLDISSADMLHLLGAAYFGFAMMNWTAKSSILGGIYGRAIVMGNFVHFLIASLSLLNTFMDDSSNYFVGTFAIVYLLMGLSFGYLLFTHPLKQ